MNKISKKIYAIGSIVLTCLICFVVVLTLNISKNHEDVLANDEQVTITVNKINTVTIYVNGEHVVKEKSDLSKDVYKVTKNSSITLRCVNESKLFNEWYIEDDEKNKVKISNSQNSLISIKAEKNLHVSTIRTDPTINDLGKYMDNPFIISEQQHIIYLQNIFDYANKDLSVSDDTVKKAYNYFFQSDPNFVSNDIKDDYFNRIQTGYFKVEQSLTILNDEFKGIGSGENTFKGVICGSNSSSSSNAQIFTSMNITDSGDNVDVYCGLFKNLTEEAVIRNLIIQNSIAINSKSTSSNNIYVGGVAGKIEDALLNNVTVSSTINITSNSKNIYAGGIAGTITSGGINEHDNLNLDFSSHVWVLTSNSTGNSIYGGIIAGYAENLYIQKASINVSKFAINAKNIASNKYNTNTNVYIGNLFGYYKCSSEKYIDNISFTGNDSEYLQSTISNGLSYVGGLIGYLDTTSASLNIGSVRFEMNTTNKSSIISESLDKNSCTNLYAGGLFAYINGNNLKATDDFKNGIITTVVDEKNVDTYQFIFDTPMEIITKQHGIQDNNNTYGNSIAGGLVANGYFNISGSALKRADILLSSDETEFSVQAIQTSSSSHALTGTINYISENSLNNNPKHCLAALMFGYVDVGSDSNSQYSYENINVYANNVNVEATREIGSRSLGDVSSTGFLCYCKSRNLQNITMYLGSNTSIMARSLSYEVGYQGNKENTNKYISSNNAYASSFISYVGSSNLTNIEINGFDFSNKQQVGTSVQIQGIQNSIAVSGSGCHDYSNENYVGGVVGCIKGDCTLDKLTFTGNSNGESQIVMEGHKDPNSAFVGGIVGFSQLMQDTSYSSATQKLTDCTIKYGKVIGNATINTEQYGNPDIYGGGILGACYSDGLSYGSLTINSPKVLYTSIECNGNERIETYVGGILGTITWSVSATTTISDAYVYKSKISSSIDATQKWSDTGTHVASRAAGILCDYVGSIPTVNYSAVIDTEINAYTSSTIGVDTSNYTIAAGISTKGATLTNCYSNSILKSIYGDKNANTYELNSADTNGSYYVTDSKSTSTNDSALVFQKFEFKENETKSLFDKLTYNNIKKFYIKIYNTEGFEMLNDYTNGVQVKANKDNCSSEAEIWINAKNGGDSKKPYDYMTEEDRINAGWFKLGNVYLVCGSESGTDAFTNITTSYIYQNTVYDYNKDLGYEELNGKKTFNVSLKSTLPTIQINFFVSSSSIYYIEWDKEVGNNPLVGYGSYTYTYSKDKNNSNIYNYVLTYTPNVEIEDDEIVKAKFLIGSSSNYSDLVFTFNLKANKYYLKGVTLAEYTPALNASITDTTGTTTEDSYLFLENTSYRLIPVLSRINESDKEIISELYCQKVSYVFVDNTNNTIRSNGEITTDDSNNTTCSVKLILKNSSNLKDNQKEKKIYFKVVKKYTVSTKSDGSNISGLPFTTSASSYNFDVSVLSHCGGIPSDNSKITIENGKTYDMSTILKNGWVYTDEKAESPLLGWDENATSYQIRIPNSVTGENNTKIAIITGNISIDITFPVYYTVEFHIQTDTFNPEFGETKPMTFSVKVAEGTTFKSLFYRENSENSENSETSYATKLKEWVKEAENASFGYLLTGFYLIDDSSSETAYGQSFDDLKESTLKINTSYVFYARWSFLIELVEAPGTHIVTSFNHDFLYTVDKDKNEYEYIDGTEVKKLFNKNIVIPINNNRGYVFTIEKDDNFIGEADVEAFIVTKDGTKNDINEIPIEKYHDNMYLYYIKPELITGYLVIATKISNSDVIVGENTASVTETIIPEDGIYTFKYIANHKKDESYIYKNNNMSLKRDILLQFKKQTYKSNKTDIETKELTDGTIIEVYYNKYINASKTSSSTIVGRYLVTEENKSSEILLSKFNNINGEGLAFDDVTFEELLGNNDSVSEVYYFVIIPPNGSTTAEYNKVTHTISGGYHNEYLYVGYCFESTDDEGQNVYNYIEGKRSENEFVNNPIAETLEKYLSTESALQIGAYTTTPSRKTLLEQTTKSNTYHFIDDNKFKVFDVTIKNGEVNENNRLVFKEGLSNKTIVRSSIISQEISELRLNLGYNKGKIKVSFYDEYDNLKVDIEIDITNETYQEYIIKDIPVSSKYFTIEKITNDEIRLSKLGVVVSDGGMLYEMEFSKTDFNSLYIPSVTMYDLNLPQLPNLEWTIEDSNYAILVNNKLEILGEGEVTLTATYTHNNIVETKTFSVFVTLPDSTTKYIDKIILPSSTGSSLYLPIFNGLEWKVKDEASAKIENNKLILLGSSKTVIIKNNLQSNSYEIDMEADTNTYSLSYLITGDTRHDGKHFILAVQTKNNSGEIEIPENIAIKVNSKTFSPIINNSSIVTAYFDLSVILDELGTNNFDLEIILNDYTVYAVQLLEVENAYKPAMGEIRKNITN